MNDYITRVSWRLKRDGSGHVDIHAVKGAQLDSWTYVFGSLGEIPQAIADAIRKDGRAWGEIAPTS